MARRTLTTLPAETPSGRQTLAAGRTVTSSLGTRRIVNYDRDSHGRLEVVLDDGDSLDRLPAAAFFGAAIGRPEPLAPIDDRLLRPSTPEFEELPASESERLITFAHHLVQVETGSWTGTPDLDRAEGTLDPRYDPATTTITKRLDTKSAELKQLGLRPNSPAALFRNLATFRKDGLSGLVHGNRRTHANRVARHDPEVVKVVTETLIRHKSAAKVDSGVLAAQVHARLIEAGHGQAHSRTTIRRLIADVSAGMALHREAASRRTHSNKPTVVYNQYEVTRPGELVQIDGCTTNIGIWDPVVGWSRATILVAIDVLTRAPLALRVCTRPTARDAAMLLCDIGRPAITRAGWPYELQHWHGMPRLVSVIAETEPIAGPSRLIGEKLAVSPCAVVLDHGAEFTATHFLAAAARNSIDVIFCPPRTPHAKGVIEAFNRSLDRIQALLGQSYLGASVANRPEIGPDQPVLTAGDLHDLLWTYILEIYMHTPHDGLRVALHSEVHLTPAGILASYLEAGGFVEALHDSWRLLTFMKTTDVTIQDYGINLNRRVYNSPAVLELRHHYQRGVGCPTRKTTAFWDPNDITRIYVRHPLSGHWLMIPRAQSTGRTQAPYSELLTALVLRNARDQGRHLDADQIHQAETAFHMAWSHGVFADRREARLAALEQARAATFAHDLADATDEFREMAFPDPNTIDPDETDEPESDDDLLDYDELVPTLEPDTLLSDDSTVAADLDGLDRGSPVAGSGEWTSS